MTLHASPSQQLRLLELQALDTRIAQLLRREQQLPQHEQIATITSTLVPIDHAIVARRDLRDAAEQSVSRIEQDVEVVAKRIAKDIELRRTASDAKTTSALEHELDTLERRKSALEDGQLEAMEALEGTQQALAEAQGEKQELLTELASLAAVRDAEIAKLASERETVAADRERIAATVDTELLALYERQRARYGIGASLLQHRTSSASGVELTATELAAIKRAAPDEVILCPESSAILVRTAESGI